VIREACGDNADADQRQRDGKEERILEHLLGEMAEIERDPEGAENRVDAPLRYPARPVSAWSW
jgi:hypothetical protein